MSGILEQKRRRGTETDTHKEENTVQTHTHKRNTPQGWRQRLETRIYEPRNAEGSSNARG